MSKLVTMNVRVEVGGRTFSISANDTKVNFRDLTESTTGKFVTDKQAAMLGKIHAQAAATVGKLTLPAEPAPKAAKAAKAPAKAAAKPAPKAKASKKG